MARQMSAAKNGLLINALTLAMKANKEEKLDTQILLLAFSHFRNHLFRRNSFCASRNTGKKWNREQKL